jgi:mxaJ protein
VHALARRGIVDNVAGYSIFGDYAEPSPLAAPIRAVERGDVDVAIAWGPVAAYFAQHAEQPLTVVPLAAASDGGIPQRFSIALATRKNDVELVRRLDAFLTRRAPEIRRLLADYGLAIGAGHP